MFLKASLSIFRKLIISALFYVYNKLSKIKYVVTFLGINPFYATGLFLLPLRGNRKTLVA